MTDKELSYGSFIKEIILWGRITMLAAFVLSFLPALYLAVWHGVVPSFGLIISSVTTIVAIYFISFLAEPLLYYPILGISGSYMSWLAGNIFNLRVPVSIASQNCAGVKEGTPEGDIISTLGMGVSVFVNIIILTIVVLFGSSMFSVLPDKAMKAFDYILPALFGAFLFASTLRSYKIALFSVPIALVFTLFGLPGTAVLFICLISTIYFSFFAYKKGWVKILE